MASKSEAGLGAGGWGLLSAAFGLGGVLGEDSEEL